MTPADDGCWRVEIVLLGPVTIGVHGLVPDGFGAFVAPVRDDTGSAT